MSKHKSLVALASILAVPIIGAVSVSAEDSSCSITNTGPNSNNTCTTNTGYTCKVTNDTVVIVDNNNQQVAQSGDASSDGNTSGGGATSGSVTNSNGTTFDFTIENDTCTVAAVKPAPTPPAGGSGAAAAAAPVKEVVRAAGGAGAAAPTVLADTGSFDPSPIVIGMLGISAAILLAAKTYTLRSEV